MLTFTYHTIIWEEFPAALAVASHFHSRHNSDTCAFVKVIIMRTCLFMQFLHLVHTTKSLACLLYDQLMLRSFRSLCVWSRAVVAEQEQHIKQQDQIQLQQQQPSDQYGQAALNLLKQQLKTVKVQLKQATAQLQEHRDQALQMKRQLSEQKEQAVQAQAGAEFVQKAHDRLAQQLDKAQAELSQQGANLSTKVRLTAAVMRAQLYSRPLRWPPPMTLLLPVLPYTHAATPWKCHAASNLSSPMVSDIVCSVPASASLLPGHAVPFVKLMGSFSHAGDRGKAASCAGAATSKGRAAASPPASSTAG